MSPGRGREPQTREISEVNVVPLADVSLVLLIILLVLSPMMTQARLQVSAAGRSESPEPPPAPWEKPMPPELVLAVALGPGGFAVGERRFARGEELAAFLRGELSARSDRKVFLAPAPEVPHGTVVSALELIRSCGAEPIALVQPAEEEGGHAEALPASP